jgi:small subunit ribosomal protein S2
VAQVGIAELLEAGVHFGHQTRRWNPKMRRFIFGERGGNYIIDLVKTQALLEQAQAFAGDLAHRGGTVLFVGTKKQARDTIKDVAESADMPYVNHRWLGGLLTNFQTISLRINRLHDLERYETEGQLELLPTRERMAAQADLAKLRANLGGVKNMQRVPDAMFVIDLKTEAIAVKEAQRLRIPIIGLVDTNCDPDGIDYVVPGNDDAIRSCALITQAIGEVVKDGHSVFRAEEERARKEAEEKARVEAEARAKREAEEQAKREAEEQAKKDADEKAAAERAAAALAQQPAPAAEGAPAAPPAAAAPNAGAASAKAPEQKAAAEQAAAAAAAQQPAPETTPVPAAPADPATLEPQTESVTPMNASPDSSRPAKEQSAPPETAAESGDEAPDASAAETADEPQPVAAQASTDSETTSDEAPKEGETT